MKHSIAAGRTRRIVFCFAVLVLLPGMPALSQHSVFTEDFEAAHLDDIAARWDDVRFRDHMSLSTDVPPASRGSQSLMMVSEIGTNTGGHLYKMFPDGFDSLFARFYVKFGTSHHPVHHFVHMGGYNPPTRWPQGGAGVRPQGNERFTSGIEPHGQRWEWDFYSYWMHMRGNPVPDRYWGNAFHPDPPAAIERGRWSCVEFMMKCNDPVSGFSGEQAFWIDGNKVLHLRPGEPRGYWVWDSFHHHPDSSGFEGFQWRSDPALRVNFFWLLYYMTQGPAGQRDTVWFDDIQISTAYSGTITHIESVPLASDLDIALYPNPFTELLNIHLARGAESISRITVHDMLGRRVAILRDNVSDPAHTGLRWDPGDMPAGLYIVRFTGHARFEQHTVMYLGNAQGALH